MWGTRKRLDKIIGLLEKILDFLQQFTKQPNGFIVEETSMALIPTDPGNSPVFTATPTPAGSVLPAGVVPTWTTSDSANMKLSVDPTGLVCTCILSTAIPVGESVTLTVSATLPGATAPITGSVTFAVGALPPPVPTGFSVVQTS